ncbi:YfbM family protein [Actinomadura rupiterrae]|uniref:YfbM family protein n=1 Tax=Actinomadura rupiterrae TaxID=559627 RepID=UPI0020A2AB1C|nr:YfbM family protein [Actinomadura rupiterrae]MCP2338535.1 hypothetical protein [Actinomadura rupiterrae]
MLEGETDPARMAAASVAGDGPGDGHDGRALDLGGDWQVLHWLLTGDAWDGRQPEADVVCGGRLLTEDGADATGADVIYLAPERVKAAAAHLDATPFASLAERMDAAAMIAAGVQDAEVPDPAARLRPAYARLTAFFRAAAGEGQAVLKVLRQP